MNQENNNIKKAVVERTVTLIIAALAFVAGLAWNDAIQSLVAVLFPIEKNSVIVKFIYAIIVTVAITVVSLRLSKINSNPKP